MSESALEQRRQAARKSRPGRRKPTPTQEAEREEAVRLTKALDLRSTQLISRRMATSEKIQDLIDEALRSPSIDFEHVARLRELAVTNMDLIALKGQVEDRYGQPRRTEQDVKLDAGVMPVLIADEGQLAAWGKAEDAHAASRAATGHGSKPLAPK